MAEKYHDQNKLASVRVAYEALISLDERHPLLDLATLNRETRFFSLSEKCFGKYSYEDGIPKSFGPRFFAPARYMAALWKAVKEEESKKNLSSLT